MEFFLSFLLLAFNILDYERNINKIAFLLISFFVVVLLFYAVYKKTRNYLCTCIVMMCHVWPYSWINVFGDSTGELQLPWFYLFGALIVLNAVGKAMKIKENKVNTVMLAVFVALTIVFVYPLIISPSLVEGLKEFIIIGFFIILTFTAFLQSSTLEEKHRRDIISAYIFVVVVTSALIIVQWFTYTAFGDTFGKHSTGVYYGNTMISTKLLMEDASSATIMLGSGVFFMLERFNNKEKRSLYLVLMLVTVVGMAFTTRRTSIVPLVICLLLYVLIHYKGTAKKLQMSMFVAALVIVMFSYLMLSRPVDDYSDYLYSNGRFELYLSSLAMFIKHPLGVGYDNLHVMQAMNENILPHNTVLRWLNMGGFVFTGLMLALLFYVLITAKKKNNKDDFWIIAYCMLAMNFIPDILNARFFVIPCMLVLLSKPAEKLPERLKYKKN